MTSSRSTTRTQAQRREQTRAQLIEATIASLTEHGYHATTTRRVSQLADSSLGALSHHFPTRLDLIAETLDEVALRLAETFRQGVDGIEKTGPERTERLLEVVWGYFRGELFTVWLKVWFAAAEDPMLFARVAPVEDRFNTAIAAIVAAARPSGFAAEVWTRRVGVALDTMRGLALRLSIEPRETPTVADPWPATRTELTAMINRPGRTGTRS